MGSLGMSDEGWDGGRLEETHVRTTAEFGTGHGADAAV